MRIAIDIRPLLRRPTGVGRYLIGLIEALSLLDEENAYLLFTSSLRDRFIEGSLRIGENFEVRDFHLPVRLVNLLWHRLRFPPVETLLGRLDIAHSPSPLIMPTRKAKRIITLHDLYFLRHPELAYGEIRRDYIPLVRKSAVFAHSAISVSQFTKNEAVELIGIPEEKVRVIPSGVSPHFFERVDKGKIVQVKRIFGIKGNYLIFVGGGEPRKNLPLALSAFRMFLGRTNFRFSLVVIGGLGRWEKEIMSEIDRLSLWDNVILTGYVVDESLIPLYAGADALLYPSRYEGFGFPMLEAMAVGTPVIASDTSSLPEIAGSAVVLLPPDDPEAWADAMYRLIFEPELRKELIKKGKERAREFSWEEAARKTLSLYRELI